MLLLLGAVALTFQVQIGPDRRSAPIVRDSALTDTASESRRNRKRGTRQPVTAQLAASAFKDATAKSTLLAARVARIQQDSALMAYDAMAYQRISAGMGFTKIGRDRLIFRHESAARVQWQRDVGIWVDVKGARSAIPMINNDEARKEMRDDIGNDPDMAAAIPYYPGYEPLWAGGGVVRAQVDETEIVNPIADGAEAYYTYQTGDSVSLRLPDGKAIQLREVAVRPRKPAWNLVVGSLWFDSHSGQLVRAAYRLSIPIDVWAVATSEDPKSMDDVPVWVKPMITPMKAEVTAIAIEYGLHEGRFWLPRLRMAEGSAQVSFMHVPFKMEESFKYASVNGKDTLPTINFGALDPKNSPPDSLDAEGRREWRDSVRKATRARTRAENDSVKNGLKTRTPRVRVCDTTDVRVSTMHRYDQSLKMAVRVPCDTTLLEHSSELPASIYDPGEELFGAKELAALKSEALSMSAQAPFQFRLNALPAPTLAYGPSMMRYNRVEGLSFGGSAEEQLGGGYSALAVGRFGLADREPNLELTFTRTNLSQAIHVSGYNHLVSASDWGRPLSFGSSFSALMFGRDEGFYYRSTGAEIGGSSDPSFGGGTHVEWRGFVEQERNAQVNTDFALSGGNFPANLVAQRATYEGFGTRVIDSYGLDPNGLRLFSDLRLEVAHGDSLYGRAALDLTASHGLGSRLAGALTVAGGSSVGGVPAQRLWYLGGSQTIRGQSPDTAQSGNAFWMSRLEIGASNAGVRPSVFTDIGWVGDRAKMSQIGRPMSGVGAGVSFLDGLFRFDVARGLYPRKQFRVDLYLESKF
ncbi:MAG TPA: BamA/TamA family outer membrane protein [Gemmatimonadaceae bacterium]|jgi:hypothetical protein